MELPVVPDDGERVAAGAVVGRLRDREHDGGCKRCVDGVAACPERLQPGGAREGMARRDHRVPRDRGHPAPAASTGARPEQRLEVDVHLSILACPAGRDLA